MTLFDYDSYKVLPLEFDEALSYSQQIAMFRYKLNELIKTIETAFKLIDEVKSQNARLENRMKYLESQFIVIRNNINVILGLLDNIDNKYDELKKETRLETAKLQKQINSNQTNLLELINKISKELTDLKNLTNQYILAMQLDIADLYEDFSEFATSISINNKSLNATLIEYINQQVSSRNGNIIRVHDPVTQKTTTLNVSLENIIELMQHFAGLTVREYDELKIALEEYDSMNITLWEYDSHAAFIFFPRRITNYVQSIIDEYQEGVNRQLTEIEKTLHDSVVLFNQYTGEKEIVNTTLEWLMGLYSAEPTIREYEEYQLTISAYDNLMITFYDYQRLFTLIMFDKLIDLGEIIPDKKVINGNRERLEYLIWFRPTQASYIIDIPNKNYKAVIELSGNTIEETGLLSGNLGIEFAEEPTPHCKIYTNDAEKCWLKICVAKGNSIITYQ